MKLWTYSIIRNEAAMLRWFVRHYSTMADRMIFLDDRSDDGSVEWLKKQPKCEVRPWPHNTGLDDEKFVEFFNGVSEEAVGKADWVAVVDADELLYAPNLKSILEKAQGDMIPATGYALIAKTGTPQDDGKSQIYELVQSGAPQENYNKRILFRPLAQPKFAHGRHYYPGKWPKHFGAETPDYGVRLLHLHHLGGIAETMQRNKRNLDRCHEKKFGWNYDGEHNFNPNQVGSVAWVERLIATNALTNVVGELPVKVQFGAGGNRLAGWKNHDAEVDIRKPLPYKDSSVTHVFAEHVIEHVTPQQAWQFLEECRRILVPGGVARIAFPDIARMQEIVKDGDAYCEAVKRGGHGDGSKRSAIKAAIFEHGHQGAWTAELMATVMRAVGFQKTFECKYGFSHTDDALCGVEGHWKVVGKPVAEAETGIIEAVK